MLSFKKEEKIKSEMQNLDKELIKLNLELEDLKKIIYHLKERMIILHWKKELKLKKN